MNKYMMIVLAGVLCFSIAGCKDSGSGNNPAPPTPPPPPPPPVKGELVVITDDVIVVGINTMKITVMPNNSVSANGFLWGNDNARVNISNVTLKLTDKRDNDKFTPSYSQTCSGVISTKAPCVITITQHELQPVFHAMSYKIEATNASTVYRSFVIRGIGGGYPIYPKDKNYCQYGQVPTSGKPCTLSIYNGSGTPVDLRGATFSSKYVTFSNNDCTDHVIPNNEICQVTETLIEGSETPTYSDVILKKTGSYVPLICKGYIPGWECMPEPPTPPSQQKEYLW